LLMKELNRTVTKPPKNGIEEEKESVGRAAD
jgi:hypothetical protein